MCGSSLGVCKSDVPPPHFGDERQLLHRKEIGGVLAVFYLCFGAENAIVRMISLDSYPMLGSVSFKSTLAFEGFLDRCIALYPYIRKGGKLINVDSGTSISVSRQFATHLGNKAWRWGNKLINGDALTWCCGFEGFVTDRKSTRLNSSHP